MKILPPYTASAKAPPTESQVTEVSSDHSRESFCSSRDSLTSSSADILFVTRQATQNSCYTKVFLNHSTNKNLLIRVIRKVIFFSTASTTIPILLPIYSDITYLGKCAKNLPTKSRSSSLSAFCNISKSVFLSSKASWECIVIPWKSTS